MKNIWYTALFVVDQNRLLERFPPKHSKVFAHHSTITFKPESLDGIDVGNSSRIKILGRVFDDKGDALLVENPKSQNRFPHITLSCSAGVGPIYSNELLEGAAKENKIEYFPDPYYIDVVEGYETLEGQVIPDFIKPFNK